LVRIVAGILVSEELIPVLVLSKPVRGFDAGVGITTSVMFGCESYGSVYGSALFRGVGMIAAAWSAGRAWPCYFPQVHTAAYTIVFKPVVLCRVGICRGPGLAAILVRWRVPANMRSAGLGVMAMTGIVVLWSPDNGGNHHYWVSAATATPNWPENWTYYSNMYISIFVGLYGGES